MTTATLRQLDIFAQMVASENIVDCARSLGVSPATVESDMHALEERLGFQLFFVDGRNVRLTPAGRKAVEAMAQLSGVGTAQAEPQDEEEIEQAEAADDISPAEDLAPDEAPEEVEEQAAVEVVTVDEDLAPIEDISALVEEPATEQEAAIDDVLELHPQEMEEILNLTSIYEEFAADSSSGLAAEAASASEPEEDWLELEPFAIVVEPQVPLGDEDLAEVKRGPVHLVQPPEEIVAPVEIGEVDREIAALPMTERSAEEVPAAPLPSPPAESEDTLLLVDEAPEAVEEEEPPAQVAVKVAYATSMSRPAAWLAAGQWIRVSPPPLAELPMGNGGPDRAAPMPVPANVQVEPAAVPLDLPSPKSEPEPPRKQVTIAAHPTVFSHFQEMLTAFEQGNSDVAITLDLGAFTAETVAQRFAVGDVDIAYYHAVGDQDGLRSRYVWSEQPSLYVGDDHPLGQRARVDVRDMMLMRPVLLDAANPMRPLLERLLGKAGLDTSRPLMESDDMIQLLNAVRGGLGYFAAFGPLARDFGKMDGIRRLPFVDPLPPIEIRQAVREDVEDDPVISSLAEYLFR